MPSVGSSNLPGAFMQVDLRARPLIVYLLSKEYEGVLPHRTERRRLLLAEWDEPSWSMTMLYGFIRILRDGMAEPEWVRPGESFTWGHVTDSPLKHNMWKLWTDDVRLEVEEDLLSVPEDPFHFDDRG